MQNPVTPHLVASCPLAQVIDGAAQVLARGREVHAHEQLSRLVGLGGLNPVVHVRCQRRETLRGEAVRDVLDVVDETPPLLDHDDTRPAAVGEIPAACATVAPELDHLAHRGPSMQCQPAATPPGTT